MKNTLIFAVFVAVVVGLLFLISGSRAPRIPENEQHAGITEKALCLECHGSEKPAAIKKKHPPKDQCFECHKTKRKVRK